jgi:hypothetical protein
VALIDIGTDSADGVGRHGVMSLLRSSIVLMLARRREPMVGTSMVGTEVCRCVCNVVKVMLLQHNFQQPP